MIITGCSRTGTSLMLMLLRATVTNKEVFIDGESSRFHDEESVICKDPAALTTISDLRDPIIMVRDPRAIVTSEYMKPEAYLVAGDVHMNGKDKGVIKNMRVALKNYAPHNIFYYEHLVARAEQVQTRLESYWGLEYEGSFDDYPNTTLLRNSRLPDMWSRKLNGLREIDKGHDWRDHLQRVRQQFDAFPELFDLTIQLGYEKDRAWYEEVMDNTKPQDYQRPTKRTASVNPKGLAIGFKGSSYD